MQYTHITFQVKDLEKSLAFYQGVLGQAVVRRAPGDHGPVFLGEAGKPTIELIGGPDGPAYSGFSLGFTVDSLEAATKKMEAAGYPRVRGPISPNPQVIFSFFKDPDGVEIQLLESKA
jgi:lactoylglutathione lyase